MVVDGRHLCLEELDRKREALCKSTDQCSTGKGLPIEYILDGIGEHANSLCQAWNGLVMGIDQEANLANHDLGNEGPFFTLAISHLVFVLVSLGHSSSGVGLARRFSSALSAPAATI